MARLILNTDDTMTIETAIVSSVVVIEQQLVDVVAPVAVESHGETIMQERPRPDGWVAGEDALAVVLGELGAVQLRDGTVVGGSVEALHVFRRAQKYFGAGRHGTIPDAKDRYPDRVQKLRLVPLGTFPTDAHAVDLLTGARPVVDEETVEP